MTFTFGSGKIPAKMRLVLRPIKQSNWTIVSANIRLPTARSYRYILSDLQGRAVQQREVQGSESPRFLSYFRNFVTLRGGAATGFHHVSTLPPPDAHRLYRIGVVHNAAHPNKSTLVVREVVWDASSLVEGDVFVIDKGTEVWQLNTKASAGKEKYRAAEFAQSLVNDRRSQCIHAIYGEMCLTHRSPRALAEPLCRHRR